MSAPVIIAFCLVGIFIVIVNERIDPFDPIDSIDSEYYQLLYSTNGTYAIVFEKDLFNVNWYLASFGMEVVAKFYGIPEVYVFVHK